MAALSVVALLSILWTSAAPSTGGIVKHGWNSVADALARECVALGIDFDEENPKAVHPSKEIVRELATAGFVGWLNGEVERGDDSISDTPPSIRDFLESHRETVAIVISVLEKGPPDWGEQSGDGREQAEVSVIHARLLPTILLDKVLLAAVLGAERQGLSIEAERALEASWSLEQSVSRSGALVSQLLFIAMDRWQAGILRKLKSPPLAWMGRLATDDPLRRMFAAFDAEQGWDPSGAPDPSLDAFNRARRRVNRAAVDRLRKLSACEVNRLTEDEIWRWVAWEVERDSDRGVRASAQPALCWNAAREGSEEPQDNCPIFMGDQLRTVTSAIRRAARLQVDRELTIKILRLKLEKQQSTQNLWPDELRDATSAACPGVTYSYRADSDRMEIQFEGSIDAPPGARALPLSFQSGKARSSPTPTPTPTPKAIPEAP